MSGRLALHYARKEIKMDEPIRIESILGTSFVGKVVEETKFGPFNAIIPEVTGKGIIMHILIIVNALLNII